MNFLYSFFSYSLRVTFLFFLFFFFLPRREEFLFQKRRRISIDEQQQQQQDGAVSTLPGFRGVMSLALFHILHFGILLHKKLTGVAVVR